MLDLVGRRRQRGLHIRTGAFAMQDVLAADVHGHLRTYASTQPGKNDMRRHDAVVQQPDGVGDAPLHELARGWSNGDLSSSDFETHDNPWRSGSATCGRWPLVQNLTLVGRRNLELFSVFGDRPPGQLEALAMQHADDLGIAQWLLRVLLLDDLANPLLDRDRRHRVPVLAVDAAVEEVLHLEHALRRVHVLVRDDTADRRFVHADIVGHVEEHQRPEVYDAVVETVALEIDDARRHLVNRLLPLLDRLDQPERGSELVLHVGAGFVGVLGSVLVEQPAVHRTDSKLRQPFFVQHRDVLILDLDDVNVGDHVLRLRRIVTTARFRIEVAYQLDVLLQIVDR